MNFILVLLAIFALLIIGEALLLKTKAHNEATRKFIHITVGSLVAFFPYFLTDYQIVVLAVAFMLTVLVSKKLNIFKSIHNVPRLTDGEFWFALTVLIFAVLQIEPSVFTVSLLIMSLADGLAAIFGVRYGKGNQYHVLSSVKSVVGTATFGVVSLILLAGYSFVVVGPSLTLWYVPICVIATALENISWRGIDNLTVPLTVAFFLLVL